MSNYVTLEDEEDYDPLVTLQTDEIEYDSDLSRNALISDPDDSGLMGKIGRFGTASIDFIKKTGGRVKDVVVENSKTVYNAAKNKVDTLRSKFIFGHSSQFITISLANEDESNCRSENNMKTSPSKDSNGTNPFRKNILPVFGVTWEECLKNDRFITYNIPTVVSNCLSELFERGIEEEGLFRISGSILQIQELRKSYDKGEKPNLKDQQIHNISGLLKLFFRELQDHMFGNLASEIDRLAKQGIETSEDAIMNILLELPSSKIKTLSLVFDLLLKIDENSKVTLMNTSNLSMLIYSHY